MALDFLSPELQIALHVDFDANGDPACFEGDGSSIGVDEAVDTVTPLVGSSGNQVIEPVLLIVTLGYYGYGLLGDSSIKELINYTTGPEDFVDFITGFTGPLGNRVERLLEDLYVDFWNNHRCSGKGCHWEGTIKGCSSAAIMGYGSVEVKMKAKDDTGCLYTIHAKGNRPRSGRNTVNGAAFGAGYFGWKKSFKNMPAPCKDPIKKGSRLSIGSGGIEIGLGPWGGLDIGGGRWRVGNHIGGGGFIGPFGLFSDMQRFGINIGLGSGVKVVVTEIESSGPSWSNFQDRLQTSDWPIDL